MRRIIIAVLVWGVFYMGTTHALNFEITKPQQNIVYLNEYMSGIGVSAVGITGKCKKDNCNYWVYIGNKRIPVSEETNLVGKGLYNSGSFALVANKKDVYVLNYKGRKTYITRQPLLGCLALSSSIIRVSNTGSPICLTSEKLYTNTKTLELPIGAVDPTIGTSYAGEWIAAYVGEDYNVYVGDTKGFNKLDVGLHSLSDLKDVVRIFPINKSQSLLSVYVYTNKRNKSLMLYQLTDFNNDKDRKVIGLPIINTIETDAGLNPSVYTTKDKKIVVSTKSLTSELQYLIDSSYFNTPEFFSNPHYEKDWVELLVGAGIRHTTWSVDQSVKAPGEGRVSIAKTKYTLNQSILKEVTLQGKLLGNPIALQFAKNEVEEGATNLEKAAAEKFYGYIGINDFFYGASSLRLEYRRESVGGVAEWNDGEVSTLTSFENDFTQYAFLKTEEQGKYKGFTYTETNMPMAVAFFEGNKSNPQIYFDDNLKIKKLTFTFGYDESQYASRYLFDYKNYYFNYRLNIGLFEYTIDKSIVQDAEFNSGKKFNTSPGLAIDGNFEFGYIFQSRSVDYFGAGLSFQVGISIDADHYLSEVSEKTEIEPDEIESSFNRKDYRFGPFLRLNLML